MTIQTAIQLPDEVYERLRNLAASSGLSTAEIISEAVLDYLEDLDDVTAAEEVLQKIESGESRTYSLEEVERRLGLGN
jgi:RHH-type rel operon transcriptional repressor/antitoxin RelB